MHQVTFELPEELVDDLDEVTRRLRVSRDDLLRRALEAFLDDHEDEWIAADRLGDPPDSALDWDVVRRKLAG